MRTINSAFVVKVLFAAVLILSLPHMSAAANDLAAITGRVHDSSGSPVSGALVIVVAESPILPERIAFTDQWGSFSVMNLFAGEYSVKVTMPRFLPALKSNVRLNAGGSVILTVNLQNALDAVRRATSRSKAQSEDIVWTLRSSRSTQPVLRLAGDNSGKSEPTLKSAAGINYSGYFQVYSKSLETSAGTTEGVGSQFSVTMPLDSKSKVTLAGQYTEAPMQPRGFGATYEFVPAARHKAILGVNVRDGVLFGDPLQSESLKEIQLKYDEDFQWSDHFVFKYGAEVGRAEVFSGRTYLRPQFGISWVPDSRTTVTVTKSSQAPAAEDDLIRGKDYFDRPAYVPPILDRHSHTEAALHRVLSQSTEVSVAVFRDHTDNEAFFVGFADGRHGVLILDTRHTPAQGFRMFLNRQFGNNFEAGVGYTTASALGIKEPGLDVLEVRDQLMRRRFQMVAARFKADVDATQTEITAVYRWMSDFSASRIDPYQRLTEYNDPTLSLSVAQNLPTMRMFPAKLQAILDARNLFEQPFRPQHSQMTQYPRLVKGGISIKF